MARQVVLGEIRVEIGLHPVAERIDLEPAVLDLEPRDVLAGLRLERLAPRNPAVEPGFRARQRLDLRIAQQPSGSYDQRNRCASFSASAMGRG